MSLVLRFTVFILSLFLWTSGFCQPAAVKEAGGCPSCAGLEEAKDKYLNDGQYAAFMEFLDDPKTRKKQGQACLSYYKALTRYSQLKHLEEKQSWDEYFANGNTYRDQIVGNANDVIDKAQGADCLKVRTRLLLWQFHQGQQDAFTEDALADLVTEVNSYAPEAQDPQPIKDAADALSAYREKAKARQLYKLYVDKLVSGNMSDDQLKASAESFYNEGNLELAEAVYDIYIERISANLSSDKLVPELFRIAGLFAYKAQGPYDMAYAEKIFAKIATLGGENLFNEETLYLRAFNLEKMKDYKKAAELYPQLIRLYPDTRHFDEAVYKIAMINAYVLGNISEARVYFEKLAAKSQANPQVISGLYQLGLLAQWEGDLAGAKSYYEALIKKSGDHQAATVSQARERLKEIAENKSLPHNLKTFLDLSLKKQELSLEAGRSELKSSAYILQKGQKTMISTSTGMPESGCNLVEVQYLWSGNLGGADPQPNNGDFQGSYADAGTKEINLVIISPAGIVDHAFLMVDVY